MKVYEVEISGNTCFSKGLQAGLQAGSHKIRLQWLQFRLPGNSLESQNWSQPFKPKMLTFDPKGAKRRSPPVEVERSGADLVAIWRGNAPRTNLYRFGLVFLSIFEHVGQIRDIRMIDFWSFDDCLMIFQDYIFCHFHFFCILGSAGRAEPLKL